MGSYDGDPCPFTRFQGLFNARAFHERLRQGLGRAPRYRDPLSVLIMDLDSLAWGMCSSSHPFTPWLRFVPRPARPVAVLTAWPAQVGR